MEQNNTWQSKQELSRLAWNYWDSILCDLYVFALQSKENRYLLRWLQLTVIHIVRGFEHHVPVTELFFTVLELQISYIFYPGHNVFLELIIPSDVWWCAPKAYKHPLSAPMKAFDSLLYVSSSPKVSLWVYPSTASLHVSPSSFSPGIHCFHLEIL